MAIRHILLASVAVALAGVGYHAGQGAKTADSAALDMPPPVGRGIYAAQVLRVLDGDTFEARVGLWPGLEITTKVRLRGIDAPEMNGRCAGERAQAEVAQEVLADLLDAGEVLLREVAPDKYSGRVVAAVSAAATPDVSAALLASGLVRTYGGGRRAPWCDAVASRQ